MCNRHEGKQFSCGHRRVMVTRPILHTSHSGSDDTSGIIWTSYRGRVCFTNSGLRCPSYFLNFGFNPS